MTAKQKQDYLQKVEDKLFEMSIQWDLLSNHDHENPTYYGILKAVSHTEDTLQTEKGDIPMKFAFTKPEQCAIYMALCCGAFNCLHLHELTNTTPEAVAMLKVLTSREARKRVLEG